MKLVDALGSIVSYVTEDEQLQLPAAPVLLSKDLSAARMGPDLSAGVQYLSHRPSLLAVLPEQSSGIPFQRYATHIAKCVLCRVVGAG